MSQKDPSLYKGIFNNSHLNFDLPSKKRYTNGICPYVEEDVFTLNLSTYWPHKRNVDFHLYCLHDSDNKTCP